MEERVFMGIKDSMTHLIKQLFTVILIWGILCTILISCLFSYYESYVQRQDARIIYEIKPSVTHIGF